LGSRCTIRLSITTISPLRNTRHKTVSTYSQKRRRFIVPTNTCGLRFRRIVSRKHIGCRDPMCVWCFIHKPLHFQRSTIPSRHVGLRGSLIEKHQLFRIQSNVVRCIAIGSCSLRSIRFHEILSCSAAFNSFIILLQIPKLFEDGRKADMHWQLISNFR
jgi:hypothetical protein